MTETPFPPTDSVVVTLMATSAYTTYHFLPRYASSLLSYMGLM